MARPREFDVDEVLERSALTFWEKGYEGTSIGDLLTATGLSKSSLYETFGSKRSLFLQSIERIRDSRLPRLGVDVCAHPSARRTIRALLEMQVETSVPGNPRKGCYLGRCAIDHAQDDPDVARRVATGLSRICAVFTHQVERGRAAREIPQDANARTLGESLATTFYGLQIMASAGSSRAMMRRVIDQAMRTLA